MATKADILHQITSVPSGKNMRFGIVVAEWNPDITLAMYESATKTLEKYGVKKENIKTVHAPGSYELPMVAQMLAEKKCYHAIICLGCIIQGETKHFDFIAESVANGIQHVGLKYNTPVIFGVLTPNNMQQAKDRSGGKYGNKGEDAAIAAIKMANLQKTI